jgi:Bacterial regulatory helix-turn-helix protein, lysR family
VAIGLDRFRSFVAVAETGGPSRGAPRLFLPAISRRLAAPEDELGIALLERRTPRGALIQTGREFLPRGAFWTSWRKACSVSANPRLGVVPLAGSVAKMAIACAPTGRDADQAADWNSSVMKVA